MWCGNNEILEALKYWGFEKKFTPEVYQGLLHGYDKLFHELLPSMVKEFDADRFYVHSSPYLANWGRPESWGTGDSHNWGVWYGKKPFESLDTDLPRFMSEFGFQSFPEMKTIATFAQAFGVRLCEVFIYKFEDGVFYSELLFEDGIKQIRLDSRTSDAIAIALRVKCDIYTTPEIVRECGVVLENSAEEKDKDDDSILALEPEEIHDETKLKKWLSLLDVDELSDRLDEAIADENYEYAKMYKDEIRRREEEGRSR